MGLDYLAMFFLLVAQKRKTQLQQSVFTYNLWDVTNLFAVSFTCNLVQFFLHGYSFQNISNYSSLILQKSGWSSHRFFNLQL